MPVGDLDLWNFTAKAGDNLVLRVGQIVDTASFTPWIRPYGPDGALLGSVFGAAVGEIALRATNSDTLLVLIANNDYYNNAGSGTSRLTVNGLSGGLKLCPPIVSGANVNVAGVGGRGQRDLRPLHRNERRGSGGILDAHPHEPFRCLWCLPVHQRL
jgi:hypothetical protein